MADYVEKALAVLAELRGGLEPMPSEPDAATPTLKGNAIELWCERAGGRVWIVTDERDAQETIRRFGAGRGEVWTASEIEIVARIHDRAICDEIAMFKRRFDGRVAPDSGRRRRA
jgi:hypothetical protein